MSKMYFERTSNKKIQIFYLILHEIFGNTPLLVKSKLGNSAVPSGVIAEMLKA